MVREEIIFIIIMVTLGIACLWRIMEILSGEE